MKRVKILRIIARLNIGGPAIHAILLTANLDKERFESILIAGNISAYEGDMSYLARNKGVNPVFINELGREISWKDDLVALWKIFKIIRLKNPDIVHTHTAKAGTLGRFSVILCNGLAFLKNCNNKIRRFFLLKSRVKDAKKIKLVHTFHGHVFHSYFGWGKTRIFLLIEKALSRFTDKIITISPEQATDICDNYKIAGRNKISVVSLGLDLNKFLYSKRNGEQFRNEYCLNNELVLIGIVGRLVPIKNHLMFFDAIKIFCKQCPDIIARFIVVGDGELRNELNDYVIKTGIERDVVFAGWHEQLDDIYAALDIVGLTSFNEGTPVSLIESMASGKAVAATNAGGVRDLMGEFQKQLDSNNKVDIYDNGVLVKSGDAQGFADAIEFMVNNKELRYEMGMRGRVFVRDRFNIDRLVKDMEMLYESL